MMKQFLITYSVNISSLPMPIVTKAYGIGENAEQIRQILLNHFTTPITINSIEELTEFQPLVATAYYL